jgi:hypothetical protein
MISVALLLIGNLRAGLVLAIHFSDYKKKDL